MSSAYMSTDDDVRKKNGVKQQIKKSACEVNHFPKFASAPLFVPVPFLSAEGFFWKLEIKGE